MNAKPIMRGDDNFLIDENNETGTTENGAKKWKLNTWYLLNLNTDDARKKCFF